MQQEEEVQIDDSSSIVMDHSENSVNLPHQVHAPVQIIANYMREQDMVMPSELL